MRFSHEPLEATDEAFRILLGGPTPGWVLVLVLVIVGTVALIRQRRPLGSLIVMAVGIGLLAEAHILWQLNRSKGIVYVDVRHYIYLVPLLCAAIVSFPTGRTASIFRPQVPSVTHRIGGEKPRLPALRLTRANCYHV